MVPIIATVQVSPDGTITAVLDSDDIAEDEEERALSGLVADGMLDSCARVAIETYFAMRASEDES